jgi:hypothetical protein
VELHLLRIFQHQIEFQCRTVLVATKDLERALLTQDVPSVWMAIQTLLTAAANISKALWGQGGKLAAERTALRNSIGVDDSSPFRDVAMRNHFEHFDERLEVWWNESSAHNYIDMSVGSGMGQWFSPPPEEKDMFRSFDTSTGDIVFWGDRFNLPRIVQEVQRVLPLVSQEARKPHSEPPSNSAGSGQ